MTIRTKIFLSFIAVIIFNSAAVAFIFLNLERQRRIARELPTFFALEEVNSKLLSKLFEAITTLDENKFKEAKDISANIKENLSKVGSVGFLSETTELTKSIDDYMNTFEKAIKGDENAFSILQEKKLTLDKDWNSLRSSVSKKNREYNQQNICHILTYAASDYNNRYNSINLDFKKHYS
jgi:CHASE3 domain sensor protein